MADETQTKKGLYKVHPVDKNDLTRGYQIYWYPDAPGSLIRNQLHSEVIYKKRQSAHRMCKKMNDGTARDAKKSQPIKASC